MNKHLTLGGHVYRKVGKVLGNDLINLAIPSILSGYTAKIVGERFGSSLPDVPILFTSFVIFLLLLGFLVPLVTTLNGWRILRAIENDYGPKTRLHVYQTIENITPGELLVLNIPAVARDNGEGAGH